MAHGEQLARTARKHPERPAFICLEEIRTFRQVDERVSNLARALVGRLGVRRGDRLGVLMANSIEMVETIFAGWRAGAIVVPVNFRLGPAEVEFILSDCMMSLLVVDERFVPLVSSIRGNLPDLREVIVLSPGAEPKEAGAQPGLEELLDTTGTDRLDVIVDERDPALIMYTSGTTGRPKGAVLSHFNVLMSTVSSMLVQRIGGCDEVWYANLPLFHIGGLSGILPYVLAGGSSVIVPSTHFEPAGAVRDLARYGITGCVFVGMQWDEICDHIPAVPGRLRLRRASWGAAGTPTDVLEKVAKTIPDVPLYSFFGQTEMSPVTCVLGAEDAGRKRGSVGRPIVNVEARLVDDAGNDVPAGEVGEIVYRGPTVMQGYWQMPEATAEAFRGGWFHSGDMCRMDEEGFLYVVDRKVDMIISGGENIYCPEVEAALRSYPGVADAAVIGVPHPQWGETPIAVVVPADQTSPPSDRQIITWCQERLASYKKPTSVVMVGDLPRNASGKVLKPVLRERYGSES